MTYGQNAISSFKKKIYFYFLTKSSIQMNVKDIENDNMVMDSILQRLTPQKTNINYWNYKQIQNHVVVDTFI